MRQTIDAVLYAREKAQMKGNFMLIGVPTSPSAPKISPMLFWERFTKRDSRRMRPTTRTKQTAPKKEEKADGTANVQWRNARTGVKQKDIVIEHFLSLPVFGPTCTTMAIRAPTRMEAVTFIHSFST
jgi:hypothetical protein